MWGVRGGWGGGLNKFYTRETSPFIPKGRKLKKKCEELGPIVQSFVSLTSSLRVISLTVLADSIYNILIFFAEKM